jgi:hypothetical protein
LKGLGVEMPRFSEFFLLNADQAQLDFVDIDTDHDTPVFLDPYAIEIRADPWSNDCAETVRQFFGSILEALRGGDFESARNLVSQLQEPSETFLGLSKGKPAGRGVGAFQAKRLLDVISGSEALRTGRLEDLSELALYVEGINRDKISDLTTNIIRSQLIDYTQSQCELLGISLSSYSGPPIWNSTLKEWRSRVVELPYIENHPIILVPKTIVRRSLSLDATYFYGRHVLPFLQAEHVRAHGSLARLVRGKPSIARTDDDGRVKKPTKEDVAKIHPKSTHLILDIVKDHPDLLNYYRKLAAERKELVIIGEDDVSVSRVCNLLSEKLKATPSGVAAATEYHRLAQGILTTIFYPQLTLPRVEWDINDGRKRIDIVYMNDAREGFLQQRREANNTEATMVIVECKNYKDDIANPELDQLLGRFDRNRGRFGWILCRQIDDAPKLLARCRDFAKAGNGFILVFTDEDLLFLLDAKANLADDKIDLFLMSKFRDIIS